jgi:class 3 adenylate cyclase
MTRNGGGGNLELQAAPQRFDFITPGQMGINQGLRTGAYGSAAAHHGVLGDGVSVAARLWSQATPGKFWSANITEAASAGYYLILGRSSSR